MSEELNKKINSLGDGIELWLLNISTIKEQDINAQVMDDRKMKVLTSNIKQRGALESLPYVYKNGNEFRVISGHHRIRAANNAGMQNIYALVETNELTKSQIASKQIAHNELVGEADKEILGEIIKQMNEVDDIIASGLPDDMLNTVNAESKVIAIPQLDFDWRMVNFTFLPSQVGDFEALIKAIPTNTELVGVADRKQYESFCNAVSNFGKARNVTSISTAVALLTEIALREVEKWQNEEDQANTTQNTTSRG